MITNAVSSSVSPRIRIIESSRNVIERGVDVAVGAVISIWVSYWLPETDFGIIEKANEKITTPIIALYSLLCTKVPLLF